MRAAAGDCVRYEDALHWVGSLVLQSGGHAVHVDGDYAYVTGRDSSLEIVRITDPSHPERLGSFKLHVPYAWTTNLGSYLYAAGGDCVQTVDLSDPQHPQLGPQVSVPLASGIAAHGACLYVSCWGDGVRIVDASDPQGLTIIGSIATSGNAQDVAFLGSVAVIAQGSKGIMVVDIADPTHPHVLSSVTLSGYARAIDVVGSWVYVTGTTPGLIALDLADPTNPRLLKEFATGGGALAVDGQRLVVASPDGIKAFDISNPASPVLLGSLQVGYETHGVDLVGNLAFVADDLGLYLADISGGSPIASVGSLADGIRARRVTVSARLACVGDYEDSWLVDLHNLEDPRRISKLPVQGSDVALEAATVVMTGEDGLSVLDVSDPTNPFVGATLPEIKGGSVAIQDQLAYVANGRFWIVDLGSPPHVLGFLDQAVGGRVAVSGDRAVVAGGSLSVIDLSDPTTPRLVSQTAVDNVWGLALTNNMALIGSYHEGLRVFDTTDVAGAREIARVDTPGLAFGVAVAGNRAYVADEISGVQIVDIVNPESPRLVGTFETPRWAFDVAMGSRCFIVADDEGGLQIAPLPCENVDGVGQPWAGTLLRAPYPNPSIGRSVISFEPRHPSMVDVAIFSVAGRLMRSLYHGEARAVVRLDWDGTDANGRHLPAGVYMVRLDAAGASETRKLVLAR
jgi:hypothetical protein